MATKKYKVLHVISELGDGGVEAMLMNLYRQIDKEKIQFDFIVQKEAKKYYDEINSFGGKVFKIDSVNKCGIFKYIKNIIRIIKKNQGYDVVHAHIVLQNGFILLAAKIAGVKIRVSHSHLTTYHRKITKILSPIFKLLIMITATKKVACGIEAGKHLYYGNDFVVLPNAIDYKKFINAKANENIIEKYNRSNDTLLIGHIGRITQQKNPKFIIEIANYIKNNNTDNFKILMVGSGPLENEIKKLIAEHKLDNNIILLGSRNDIPELLKTFDILILPSLYEGLPVVLIEAQASGIPSIISSTITNEADLGLGLLRYTDLSSGSKEWTKQIYQLKGYCRPDSNQIKEAIKLKGYNIESSILLLQDIYNINFS